MSAPSSATVGGASLPALHHEKQTRMHCALHATNAILQAPPFFTAADFDALARGVDAAEAAVGVPRPLLFSPHKVPLLGVWSIEVVLAALAARGLEAAHYPSPAAGAPERPGVAAFLLSRAAGGLSGYLGGRHFIALAPVGGVWHNFDSQLDAPRVIGGGALADVLRLLAAEPASSQPLLVARRPGA